MRRIMTATCFSMALTAGQAAADELDDLALRKQRAETEAAELALAKEKAAFQASKVTLPASGYTGAVETGDDAGLAESLLLANRALKQAAASVAAEANSVCPAGAIVLFVGEERPNNSERRAFDVIAGELERRFRDAGVGAPISSKPDVSSQEALAATTAITAGLALLSYFKTDYSLAGADLGVDQQLFGRLVARKLLEVTPQRVVIFYDAYDPASLGNGQTRKLASLAESARRATEKAGQGASAERKAELLGVVADWAAFEKVLYAPDANGVTPLLRIQRQAKLAEETACSLNVNVHHVAGSHYTKRNIATGLGSMPFYASAMTTTSYRAWDKFGNLTGVGVFPVDQPFVAFDKIHPKSRAQPERRAW